VQHLYYFLLHACNAVLCRSLALLLCHPFSTLEEEDSMILVRVLGLEVGELHRRGIISTFAMEVVITVMMIFIDSASLIS
jgi:hypothetical protein